MNACHALTPVFIVGCVILAFLAVPGADAGKVPSFTVESIDGGSYNLADDLGRCVILLEFWGTCCKTNLSRMSYLEDLHKTYHAKGLKVLAVNVDDVSALSRVKPSIRKYGYTFPILLDPTQEVLQKFSPAKVKPCSVIIGRNEEVVTILLGYKPGNETIITDTITRMME